MKIEWSEPRVGASKPYWKFAFNTLGALLDPLDPTTFASRPDRPIRADEGLIVSGKGPIWYYFGLLNLFHTASWSAVDYPRLAGAVVVRAKPEAPVRLGDVLPALDVTAGQLEPSSDDCQPEFTIEAIDSVRMTCRRAVKLVYQGGRWLTSACLAASDHWLPRDELIRRDPEAVQLSGTMPIWLALVTLDQLRQALPGASLLLDDPRSTGAVVLAPGQGDDLVFGQVVPHLPRQRPAPCVALVGDPQSGKSTLSWKIYHELQRMGIRAYRLDCDAQAPTAPWGMSEYGETVRKQYKKERGEWTTEDVRRLVRQVQSLKQSHLDLVLLDMPGGNLKASPPEHIPVDRVSLFREVDHFVRLDKNEAARDGWTVALDAVNLAYRIVAAVKTCPDASMDESWPADQPLGTPEFHVHQLDRKRFLDATPAVEELCRFLARKSGLTAVRD